MRINPTTRQEMAQTRTSSFSVTNHKRLFCLVFIRGWRSELYPRLCLLLRPNNPFLGAILCNLNLPTWDSSSITRHGAPCYGFQASPGCLREQQIWMTSRYHFVLRRKILTTLTHLLPVRILLQSLHLSFINLSPIFYSFHKFANNNAINRLLRRHWQKHDLLSCPGTTGGLSLYCM